MNRKLVLLNVVLVALAIYAGFQLRSQARAARQREAATLNRPPKVLAPHQWNAPPAEPAVLATGYADVAMRDLFDRSRNPTVVVEVPPAPPPPPMPPLPIYHGMMTLGSSGVTAFFSLTADSVHLPVHIGEMIGQFKLLSVNSDEIVLEWNGQVVRKPVSDMSALRFTASSQPAQGVRTEIAPAPAAAPPPVKSGPGPSTAFGFKTCIVNDGNPEGAVIDGYKKQLHVNPFGTNCTWEPVGK